MHSWRVHKRQFSSNSDLACIKMWVSSKLECDVVFFYSSSLCVCVCDLHIQVILCQSLSELWLTAAVMLPEGSLLAPTRISLSLSQSILSSFSSFAHFLSVSPAHKPSFLCETVIDMFPYLQQSALHFCHHKTHMLKHFYSILKVPLGKFAVMIKNSQKGLKQANYFKISIKINSKFIDQIQNVAEGSKCSMTIPPK